MHQHMRALAAFVIAPPLAVAIFLIPDLKTSLLAYGIDHIGESLLTIRQMFYVGTLFAWMFAFVLGVPIYILLRGLDIASPWVTIVLAAAIGASFDLAFELWPDEGTYVSANGCNIIVAGFRTACGYWELAKNLMWFGSIGAIGGLIFWLIYAGGWKAPSRAS